MHDEIDVIISGAKSAEQVLNNLRNRSSVSIRRNDKKVTSTKLSVVLGKFCGVNSLQCILLKIKLRE
jgi:hypothetical protein